MLYQIDLRGCTDMEVMGNFWTGISAQPDERAFAERVVQGVYRGRRDIDALIEKQSINWKINRMPLVDRNILRLGVFELREMRDIPVTVTLNEAIELGKRYSTQESGSFINGILDKIARALPPGSRLEAGPAAVTDDETYLEDDEA
jgi:N utilization substance protein B